MAFLGEIRIWPAEFVPEGWAACDGALLDVQSNQALYSIIGNNYGGDIKQFALPDLRGCFPVGSSRSNGYPLAIKGGAADKKAQVSFAVPIPGVPEHTHEAELVLQNQAATPVQIAVTTGNATSIASPNANPTYLGVGHTSAGAPINLYTNAAPAATPATLAGVTGGVGGTTTGSVTIKKAGTAGLTASGSAVMQVNVIPPYLPLGFIICISGGDYPPRREDDQRVP